ncbi:MAG: winged helix-turn-helix domain-containing protein [Nitrososphaerota archaeon]
MKGGRKRNPKGYSEPIIMRALLKNALTVSQLEKVTKIKKPTIYLSLNRLSKLGYVRSDKARRNRKFYLTPAGKKVAMNRMKAERILQRVMRDLKQAVKLGISIKEIVKELQSAR